MTLELVGVPVYARGAVAAALVLGCSAPTRPPVPDTLPALDALAPRVERTARLRDAARRLDDAELAMVVSDSPRERRAARAAWLDARHELRALARESGGTR